MPRFTARQVAITQMKMREVAGEELETFDTEDFIAMLSVEVEELRATSKSDLEIARIMSTASGEDISADDIGRYFLPEQEGRRKPVVV
jgi:hypothetical protein